MTYSIFLWTGARMFNHAEFDTYEEANEFLGAYLLQDREADPTDYVIKPLF